MDVNETLSSVANSACRVLAAVAAEGAYLALSCGQQQVEE